MRICPKCEQEFPDNVLVCPTDEVSTRDTGRSGDPLLGKVLDGRWKLEAQLGKGGMGKVYRSTQLSVHREVAIKVIKTPLLPSRQLVARFMREAQSLSAMRHPNIVKLIDFGQDEDSGLLYIVMELLPGRSLHYILDNRGTLSLLQIVKLGEQLMSALSEAHSKGIIHRDIKPRNMMLEQLQGVGIHITLVDFGLAHTAEAASEQLTRQGAIQGTPKYMPPEQIKGETLTPGSDLYAAGVVLYRLLTGRAPFVGTSAFDILNKHLTTEAAPIREHWQVAAAYNPRLSALVTQMMAKDPSKRPVSALAVLHELQHIRTALTLSLHKRTSAETLTRRTFEELARGPSSARSADPNSASPRRDDDVRSPTPPHRRGVLAVTAMSVILFSVALLLLINTSTPGESTGSKIAPSVDIDPRVSTAVNDEREAQAQGLQDAGADIEVIALEPDTTTQDAARPELTKQASEKPQRFKRTRKRRPKPKKSSLDETLEEMSREEP